MARHEDDDTPNLSGTNAPKKILEHEVIGSNC